MFCKKMLSLTIATVGALTIPAEPVPAQEPTLAERVEASGGKPIAMTVLRDVTPVPITELSVQSDLVVTCRLVRQHSYLSEDKKQIFTDYLIVPRRVLRTRNRDVQQTPGPTPRLILTLLGGEIMVNGTQVTMTDEKMRPLSERGEFLVFATRLKPGDSRFHLTQGSAAIFEVSGGQRVEPLFRRIDADPEVHGVPFEEIVRRVQAAGQRK